MDIWMIVVFCVVAWYRCMDGCGYEAAQGSHVGDLFIAYTVTEITVMSYM
jgi:hypothetical protein